MKDELIKFRIQKDAKELFFKWCSFHDTTPSYELAKFVLNVASWQYEDDHVGVYDDV